MEDTSDMAVHDHGPSYRCYQPDVHHAYCLAHLVQTFTDLVKSGET